MNAFALPHRCVSPAQRSVRKGCEGRRSASTIGLGLITRLRTRISCLAGCAEGDVNMRTKKDLTRVPWSWLWSVGTPNGGRQ